MIHKFALENLLKNSPLAVISQWLAKEGDYVEQNQPICDIEIDKAVVAVNSTKTGYLRKIIYNIGETFDTSETIALLSDKSDEIIPKEYFDNKKRRPFPLMEYFDNKEIDQCSDDVEKLDAMQMTIARRTTMSKISIPCFYLTSTVDMTECEKLRQKLKDMGYKATYNDMIIKSCALAIKEHPRFSYIFTDQGFMARKNINIGMAVALEDYGLVVPVIKEADKKSLKDIAIETRELIRKTRYKQLSPEECSEGIFTVSNLSHYEVDQFIAIVNPGESAIMAVGKITETPVIYKKEITVRPIMKITLSCDHRSIGGTLAGKFNAEVKYLLENPEQLI